jgi:hypothetical protein
MHGFCRGQIPEPPVEQSEIKRKGKAGLIPHIDRDLAKQFDGRPPKHCLVIDL